MRKIVFLLSGILFLASAHAGAQGGDTAQAKPVMNSGSTHVTTARQMPGFEDGDLGAFAAWVQSHLSFPDSIPAKTVVSFVIDTVGRLGHIEVIQSANEGFTKAVIQTVSSSPRWTPGRNDDGPVNVKLTLPVVSRRFPLSMTRRGPQLPPDVPVTPIRRFPSFRGGSIGTFRQWVVDNVDYPRQDTVGRITVNFVIDTAGNATKVMVTSASGQALSDEVARVVKGSPRWTPAYDLNGKLAPCPITMNIEFLQKWTESAPVFMGGGIERFREWVDGQTARSQLMQAGIVFLSFVVDADGRVADIFVHMSAGDELSDEAVSILSRSPIWTPGYRNGQPIGTKYNITVNFTNM